MLTRESRHEYFTDDELLELVKTGTYTDEDARRHQNARETYKRRQEQKQSAADKQARKNELDHWARRIHEKYPLGQEGEGFKFIAGLGLDVDEQKYLHERYSSYIQDAKTGKKNTDDALKAAKEQAFNGMLESTMLEVDSQDEINERRKSLQQMFAVDHSIEEHHYNTLMKLLHDKEQNIKLIAKGKEEADNKDIATDYVARFGVDGEAQAREELRQTYTDPKKITGIMHWFNELAQEKREKQNDEAKAKRVQQEQTFIDLQNNYWRQGKTVSNETLSQLEQSRDLSVEQLNRAYTINYGMRLKKNVEEQLSQNPNIDFNAMSHAEREAYVMQIMGTSQEKRKQNVAYLLQKVIDGTSSDSEITLFEATGQIAASDKDYIKEYDSKFDRQQKTIIQQVAHELNTQVRNLYAGKSGAGLVQANALADFYRSTSTMDLRAKNFTETLDDIFTSVLGGVLQNFKDTHDLTGTFWIGRSSAGQRYDTASNFLENYTPPAYEQQLPYQSPQGVMNLITPAGNTQTFDNSFTPQPLPEPATQQSSFWGQVWQGIKDITTSGEAENLSRYDADIGSLQLQSMGIDSQSNNDNIPPAEQKPMNLGLAMIANGTVTGHFSDWRAYRSGQHNGVDVAGLGNITLPQTNIPLTVSKVNTKTPHKGGGNSVTLSGTDSNGDTWDFIISHMQNGSVSLNVGDVVLPGEVVGKVGNTGMTSDREKGGITRWYEGKKSGYHMDLKIKKNGKYIDPENFTPPAPFSNTQQNIAPQQLVQPTIRTYQEQYDDIRNFLFGGMSGDIWHNDGGLF